MQKTPSKNSTKTTSAPVQLPRFNSEREEAEWYHSPEGRRFMDQRATAAGPLKRLKLDVQRTDPVVLEALVEHAKAKQGPQTIAISLRLPSEDLEKAKKIAARAGIGYQKLIKEIIHESLTRMAS